tara:strand:- start:1234 stop:1854 length:621 start_codon:yes stop_codon:yes gene_type:complete
MDLDDIKAKLSSLTAQKELLNSQMKNENKLLRELKKELIDEKKAHALATTVAEEIQGEFGKQLSDLVTSCLNIVFVDDHYEFDVKFETKRNSTSVNFTLLKNGVKQSIMDGSGGGIISVVTVGLRFAMFAMKAPRSRSTIVIDEGFSALRGVDNIKRVYAMLEEISSSLGLQIILINNANEDLEITEDYNMILVENNDGIAEIKYE